MSFMSKVMSMSFMSKDFRFMSMHQVLLSLSIVLVSMMVRQLNVSFLEGISLGILSILSVMSMLLLTFTKDLLWEVQTAVSLVSAISTKVSFIETRLMYSNLMLHEQMKQICNHFREYDPTISGIEWLGGKVANELMIMRTVQMRAGVPLSDEWGRMVMRFEKGPEMSMINLGMS